MGPTNHHTQPQTTKMVCNTYSKSLANTRGEFTLGWRWSGGELSGIGGNGFFSKVLLFDNSCKNAIKFFSHFCQTWPFSLATNKHK